MKRRIRLIVSSVVTVGALLTVPVSFADNLPDLGESARAEFSPQMERRIGESIMNEIRLREPSYLDDPEISDYVNRLGKRLVESSANPGASFHFFLIRDASINAFAMFGGFIGINTGTVLSAQSESELAGVIAHEIAHVTQNHLARQIANEKQNTIPGLIAMAIGILAARANTDIAAATVSSAQAGMVQSQLAYSRDFEREADRVGYQTLANAGFDVRSLGDFFERLQSAGRLSDSSAPVYLRSHPLTVERISDMQNRAQGSPYRQVLSDIDFYLVRAKLTAQAGTPQEAIAGFESQLREKKYVSRAATIYGLMLARLRARDVSGAKLELGSLASLNVSSPIISGLMAQIESQLGNVAAAQSIFRDALQRFPQSRSLAYGYAESLLSARKYDEAQAFLHSRQQSDAEDFKLFGLQAKIYAAQGKRMAQHRAQAEFYFHQGLLGQAVEQLQFAQQATDGNFYEQSAVDARLRELRKLQLDEEKQKRDG